MNGRISLAVKNGLVYMAIMLLACILLGYLLLSTSSRILKNKEFERIESSLSLLQIEFQDYVLDVENDVRFLANQQEVRAALQIEEDAALKPVEDLFANLLNHRASYSQIRLISDAQNGYERVRVDRKNQLIQVTPKDSLQFKGDRGYYQKTKALSSGSLYFSAIDLNKERGKISTPRIPTLRAACPLYSNEEFLGIIVINLDLRSFFASLRQYTNSDQHLVLLSNKGDFLIHPDSSQTFGFEYEREGLGRTWIDNFVSAANPVQISEFAESEFFFFEKWPYPLDDYHLILGLGIPEQSILKPIYDWRQLALWWVGIIVILAGMLGFVIMQRQRGLIRKIISNMTYPLGPDERQKLPLQRKDEIGELAKSFDKLLDDIEGQVQKTENERQQAIDARREKEVFIENMSHELRNPLQNIQGMREVLLKNDPREDQLPILNSMGFSTSQLRRLVDDVLDYALMREGQLQIRPKPLNVITWAEELMLSFKHEADMKKQSFVFECDPKLQGREFELDGARLGQVVSNLLSNAIKYTPNEGQVKFKVLQEDEYILFQVEDTGLGISEELLTGITSRFERAGYQHSQIQGAGLGLSVVVELLNLMNSKLVVTPNRPLGTSFSFRMNKVESLEASEESKDKDDLYWPGLESVLIIDDDEQIRLWYEHVFQDVNASVRILKSAEQLDGHFDLIISDVEMNQERIDPWSLSRFLSPLGLLIVVSGHEKPKDSPLTWIQKPVNINALYTQWNVHWSDQHLQSFSSKKLREDYDHNPEVLEKIYRVLERQWLEMTANLIESMKRNDTVRYKQTFHKLTTTLKTLGLRQLDNELDELVAAGAINASSTIRIYQDLFHQIYVRISSLRDS